MDFVRVRKADGTVVSATASDIQDLSAPLAREAPIYTDLRQKHITVPGLRPGDTLEYRIVWNIHSALTQNHFWVEHDFITRGPIVLDDTLTVDIPAASKVKLKTEPGYEPTIKEEKDRRIYAWKHANLKKASDEDEKEKDKDEEEEVEEKDPDEIRPAVQMTTFQSWDEVGKWYAGLQSDRVVPDEKIKLKAEEIIKGRATEKEKVTALYEYVAKNFRYVSLSLGQGRYQPHAAAEVMSNQYGDCKDKHTLLASMLAKQLGIPKVITRVSRAQNRRLFERVGIESPLTVRRAAVQEVLNWLRLEEADHLASIEDRAEVMEVVYPLGATAGLLRDFGSPPNSLVGAVLRRNRVLIPDGSTELLPGDHLFIVTGKDNSEPIEQWLAAAAGRDE